MAETPSKRLREETQESEPISETFNPKRQKYSYNDILSLLDSDDETEPTQDPSSLITTLQQELSSGFDPTHGSSSEPDPDNSSTSSWSFSAKEDDQEEYRESVMRHLLEASDDELGIPNRENDAAFSGSAEEVFAMAEGLWELEDEAANYYTLLQSELFM